MDYQLESRSTDMPQLPEVIVDGHIVAPGSKEILSEVYEVINMANIAKIRKRADDQAAQGWAFPYDNWPVSPIGEEIILDKPAQAMTLINDGPAAIQVSINNRINLITVNLNQAYNINFGNHTLRWFFLICGAGLAATVRVVVKG